MKDIETLHVADHSLCPDELGEMDLDQQVDGPYSSTDPERIDKNLRMGFAALLAAAGIEMGIALSQLTDVTPEPAHTAQVSTVEND